MGEELKGGNQRVVMSESERAIAYEKADQKRQEKVELNKEMWQKAQDLINIATSENASPEGLRAYIDNANSSDPKVEDGIRKTQSSLKAGNIQPVQAYIGIVWAQIRAELEQRELEIDRK